MSSRRSRGKKKKPARRPRKTAKKNARARSHRTKKKVRKKSRPRKKKVTRKKVARRVVRKKPARRKPIRKKAPRRKKKRASRRPRPRPRPRPPSAPPEELTNVEKIIELSRTLTSAEMARLPEEVKAKLAGGLIAGMARAAGGSLPQESAFAALFTAEAAMATGSWHPAEQEKMLRMIVDRIGDKDTLDRMATRIAKAFGIQLGEVYTLWFSPEYPVLQSLEENWEG